MTALNVETVTRVTHEASLTDYSRVIVLMASSVYRTPAHGYGSFGDTFTVSNPVRFYHNKNGTVTFKDGSRYGNTSVIRINPDAILSIIGVRKDNSAVESLTF